jgi:hypothetical protein
MIQLGCHKVGKQASHQTGYGSGERTRIDTNHSNKAIHFPIIPLFVNGNPIMSNIFGVVQEKMMRLNRASLAIRH